MTSGDVGRHQDSAKYGVGPLVAVCQVQPEFAEVAHNLALVDAIAADAAGRGARLAVFPECALTGYAYEDRESVERAARHATESAHVVADIARRLGIAIVVGTLEENEGRLFNSALIADPRGRLSVYRKAHLPGHDADRFVHAGTEPPSVLEVLGIRTGTLICYDLRFPEIARVLGLDAADVIAVPTNWTREAFLHPSVFARARASENRCYVLAANRVGRENGREFVGGSLIVAPDGHVLATGPRSTTSVLVSRLDLTWTRTQSPPQSDGGWDTISDRRPELYRRLLAPATRRSFGDD